MLWRTYKLLPMAALFIVVLAAAAVTAQTQDDRYRSRQSSPSPSPKNTSRRCELKDIARFEGVRDNQLFGMGLVIGLEGTGDGRGSQANIQMVANMLERFGITVDRDAFVCATWQR